MSPEVCQELDNLLARRHHGDEDAILLQPGAGDVGDGHLQGEVTLPRCLTIILTCMRWWYSCTTLLTSTLRSQSVRVIRTLVISDYFGH